MQEDKQFENHKALIDVLMEHDATQKYVIDYQPSRSSERFKDVDTHEINTAVSLLVTFLNLSGGTVANMDLYELLQAYIRHDDVRDEINTIVNKHL